MLNEKVSVSEFIEAYKNLEKKLRRKYKIADENSIKPVFKNPELGRYGSTLALFADVRNLISHIPTSYVDKILLINKDSIQKLQEIAASLKKKPRINSMAIPLENIITAIYNDNVVNGVKIMRDKNINSLVFLENNQLSGFFRYKTIIEKYKKGELFILDEQSKFSDLRDHIDITKNNDDILFVKHNDYTSDVFEQLKLMRAAKRNIEFIVLTSNGKVDGKLMGLFTPQRFSQFDKE